MKNISFNRIHEIQKTFYLLFLTVSIFSGITQVLPCNVPVFRYALERWTADPYRLVVYHQQQIQGAHRELLKDLEKSSFQGDSTLNLIIQYKDLNNTDQNPLQDLDDDLTYPIMMLFYPEQTGIPYPLWLGELNKPNIDLLKDSPTRNEVANLLLAGETTVFLFLESGESAIDQKYFNLLKQELESLSTKIKIPTSGVDVDGNPIEVSDFKNVDIKFSVRKISRQDPSEKIFVKMLLGTESDLSEYQEPLVFPMFGQGRSLYALVGAGINQKTIEKACQSLVAWCSCEIKAMHQGVDLLFHVKWSEGIGNTWIKEEDLPPLTGLSGFISPADKNEKIAEQIDVVAPEKPITPKQEEKKALIPASPDTALQVLDQDKAGESSSLSKSLGLLLLTIISLLLIFSLLIKKKIIRVKR